MTTSKSPRRVLLEALAVGRRCLPAYAHRFAPKKFTQPQLFACLVLKDFEKKDYRGIRELLLDCPDLAAAIGLKVVPHWTTLQKASARLLKLPRVRELLGQTVRRIHRRRHRVPYAAGDSSGFDARHASRYFIWRTKVYSKGKGPKKRTSYRHFGKLMVIVCCATHAVLAAVASAGPSPDVHQLGGVPGEVPAGVRIGHMVLDAGFDSAANHRLLREGHGILSSIPPETGRRPKDPATLPSDKYRRLMKRRFRDGKRPKAYRTRTQVETVFSMLKRNPGSALRGRSHHSRRRDLFLRVLTHNIMLALSWVFYRAGHPTL
jgi:hypothetical protein